MKRRHPCARAAFTIVELLVAMALIIFIMYILAEAFAAGTVRVPQPQGDRRHERAPAQPRHDPAPLPPGRPLRRPPPPQRPGLLEERPAAGGLLPHHPERAVRPPRAPTSTACRRSSPTPQALHFTVKLRGNNRGDFFRASVPNCRPNVRPCWACPSPTAASRTPHRRRHGAVCSAAAEVAIFLRDTGV